MSVALLGITVIISGCGSKTAQQPGNNPNSGLNLPAAHTQQWVEQIGNQTLTSTCPLPTSCTPTNDVYSTATDSQGNVVFGGETLTEFPGNQTSPIHASAFAAKYSDTGMQMWVRQFGPDNNAGYAITTSVLSDTQGHTYVGGYTTGAFPGYVNPDSNIMLFLAKIDSSGNVLSVQQYDTGMYLFLIAGETITMLPSGNIAFGWLAAGSVVGSANSSFFYVVNPSTGKKVWQRSYPGANELQSLTSDAFGNLIASGVSLGLFPGNSSSTTANPWVIKADGTNGNLIWQQTFNQFLATNPAVIGFSQVAVDKSGDVVLGGATAPTGDELCAGLCTTQLVFPQSALVAKLSGDTGDILWTKEFSTGSGDGVTSVAVEPTGNIFAVGFTYGLLSAAFNQPTDDLFALKLDTNGNPIWAQQFGTGPWMYGAAPLGGLQAATDSAGNLFVAAETEGAFAGISNPTNLGEAFVMKFGP